MEKEDFSLTTTQLAAAAGCLPETIRLYAKLDLVESMVLPGGVRIFRPSAVPAVKKIFAERMARRGGDHSKRATA